MLGFGLKPVLGYLELFFTAQAACVRAAVFLSVGQGTPLRTPRPHAATMLTTLLPASLPLRLSRSTVRMALSPGANVLVLGKGPVMILAAKLAAL